jgi:uncharacterized DUF497 family protein
MRIVFDEPKRIASLNQHGLDFADFESFEWDSAALTAARHVPGTSRRYKAAGWLNGKAVSAVFSLLGTEAVSLISLRPANKKERSQL